MNAFQPQNVIIDFKKSEENAIREVFPGSLHSIF